MNRKIFFASLLILIITCAAYKILDDALYLKLSKYKVPDYPVWGSDDSKIIYKIDPQTILDSIENKELDIFTPISSHSKNNSPVWEYGTFSWKQEDYLKIANALHQTVWDEPLNEWLIEKGKFLQFSYPDSKGFEYANLVFYKRQNNEYTVHEISIDPLFNTATTSEDIYYDTDEWTGFNLDSLFIKSADQALLIADKNGGNKACVNAKSQCDIGLWLGPTMQETSRFLYIPIYQYNWEWIVSYYSTKSGDEIFSADIDPFNGMYQVRDDGQ